MYSLKGIISDYTPAVSPMVPAIVVHCLREIEDRGINELGLYRIPGSEKDVKGLKVGNIFISVRKQCRCDLKHRNNFKY